MSGRSVRWGEEIVERGRRGGRGERESLGGRRGDENSETRSEERRRGRRREGRETEGLKGAAEGKRCGMTGENTAAPRRSAAAAASLEGSGTSTAALKIAEII